ncbi:hypothetical protein RB213_011925 [Colletotrichum asianum]
MPSFIVYQDDQDSNNRVRQHKIDRESGHTDAVLKNTSQHADEWLQKPPAVAQARNRGTALPRHPLSNQRLARKRLLMSTMSTYTLQALTSRFLELCLEATIVICTKQAAAETFHAASSPQIKQHRGCIKRKYGAGNPWPD